MTDYAGLLRARTHKIGVWGAGAIGFSTMAHFARAGVASLGLDVVPRTVDAINRGEVLVVGLLEWLGFDVRPLVRAGLIRATLDHRHLLQHDILVHFVCIPTEKDGKPFNAYLEDVVTKLAAFPARDPGPPPLVIIESTLTPGTTEKVVIPIFAAHGRRLGRDVLLGIAPRRDWFVDQTKSLKELDRVFGGCDEAAARAMRQVLGLVCDHLHAASSHRTAEMVKSFENAYRHMEITLANQLSLAYPNEDIREALRLVGTKWNIGTFYPGFGTGGYCIPLSSQYVIAGAERPERLSILADTVETDTAINRIIARSILARGFRHVGVLGLAYKADLKVSILSPTIPFVEELQAHGVTVELYDPFYADHEVKTLVGVPTFEFPGGLRRFDAVVAVVDHRVFKEVAPEVPGYLDRCRFVLDNPGMWSSLRGAFAGRGIEYHAAGDAGWLGPAGLSAD